MLNRIQKMSRWILFFLNVSLILIPTLSAISWLLLIGKQPWEMGSWWFTSDFRYLASIATPEGQVVDLSQLSFTPMMKVLGFLGSLLEISPVFLGCWFLRKIFKNYRRNEIFSYDNARFYQKLGGLFFYDAFIVKPLSYALFILIATLPNGSGHRFISISFNTDSFKSLFCGLVVLVIAWVMKEGCRLQEEQQFTV